METPPTMNLLCTIEEERLPRLKADSDANRVFSRIVRNGESIVPSVRKFPTGEGNYPRVLRRLLPRLARQSAVGPRALTALKPRRRNVPRPLARPPGRAKKNTTEKTI